MKGITDTSSVTYRQLMGNGMHYQIPPFQRDYTWEEEQWDDLWFDIMQLRHKEEDEHYMGYLVLQSADFKNFHIIDGQQRLTTLSIVVLVVLKCLQDLVDNGIDPDSNRKRMETLRNSYIGYTDPVTLITDNKLKLNRNSDSYYRNYLVLLKELPVRNTNNSEKGLRSCFLWFYEKIKKEFTSGETLAGLIESISDKLHFTRIIVSDEFNAFKVFETLNARGVQLSAADLLKNYLFSVVDESKPHLSELNELENLWGRIIDKLRSEKFEEFLRYYWNGRNRTVRKGLLFKSIRSFITKKEDVFALIRELDEYADIYMAFLDPEDEFWRYWEQSEGVQIRPILKELKLFQIRQHLSLFLTAFKRLPAKEFVKLARTVSILTFRYNIIGGYNPNEQEDVYNQVALKIFKIGSYSISDFKSIYISDEKFTTDFTLKTFKSTTRNHKIVKYILASIEKNRFQNDLNYEGDLYTIEHILPENADEGWGDFSADAISRSVYRMGNMALLEKNLNKEAASKSFGEKKHIYLLSKCMETRLIAENFDSWNETNIEARQRQLAKYAKTIWSIDFK